MMECEMMQKKGNKNMKRIVMILMAVALIALPTMAQQDQWQSTSTMQGSGSAYSAQVTEVGATSANEMVTTTYSSAKAPSGPRRVIGTNSDGGEGSNDSPIGDAVLPLMLMALAYAAVIAFRKRKETLNR